MALRVRDISYSYGSKQALNNVSFELVRGEFCALLGPNGAGKSTLFSLLTRLLVPTHGTIEIGGYDLHDVPTKALGLLGIVFQQTTLDLDLTVRQNLLYFAALHGISGKVANSRIDEALTKLNMRDRSDETIRSLNGGHRRRTEIARSLIHSPSVLLLDEPTVGLDPSTRQTITQDVHSLTHEGLAVLWATHLTDEIQASDRLVILHQGKVKADQMVSDLPSNQSLSDYFLSQTNAGPR